MTRDEHIRRIEEFLATEDIASFQPKTQTGASGEFFSWRACDCCRSPLGGDRYACNAYHAASKSVVEYDGICVDCVLYVANGCFDGE